ncbi:MAG: hypothetical protein HBSAPP03_24410 [Phycisphaerae bacterium]|nr:MAG: hypothetical protein HBSAPP03_24410 [Phycisphaerae bacterium]
MRLALEHVRKQFSGVIALEDVTLEVPEGACLAVLGPSGCGKSTLLRIVAGLEEPTAGRVMLDDRDMTQASPASRGVGLVVQDAGLYPHLTLRECLAAAGRGGRDEVDRAVGEVAGALGLAEVLQRRPGEVSGGQRRRAALARELIRRPGVLLLDEPCASLDPESARDARAVIMRVRAELGCTVILATHDQDEAFAMADSLAVMRAGRIEQVGPPREVHLRPTTRFVGGFLGRPPMCFLRGRVEAGPPARFHPSGVLGPIDLGSVRGPGAGTLPGREVVLGIRPGQVTLADHGPRMLNVVRVERLVDRTDVYLDAGEGTITASTLRDGDEVRGTYSVGVDSRGAVLFEDSPEGRRIDVELDA